ncbi:glycerate kinase [Thermogemmatispora sp.]|uniref:glycerate kinase n=1 Tax=Thermogemmatispora sp. TaxID=1968838 RepID=UPI001D9BDE5F|nr:glycerate kinase [Thermogemmatispora sp.]MBX5451619.1 glycerate kinase [Thermogemmatispora sp.]
MRIVIAPQALKGSLTAPEAARAIARGLQMVLPTAELDLVPIADGGEGTVEALVSATGGQLLRQEVTGPLGEPVEATFGLLGDGQTAVIEMAACAGLPLVPPERRDPRLTTTYGVGELIRAALDHGCRHLIIGIGGSATNDGGAGMAQALGAHLLDAEGQELPFGGAALAHLARIVLDELDPRLRESRIEVACDVTNPLCGPQGASAVYGPQKGATPAMIAQLDAALEHYAEIIQRDLGRAVRDIPGAGAAGGLGAGLLAFLEATLRSGADLVLEAVGLPERLRGASLLITAEGQIDRQTAYGKSVGAVASLAQRCGIPVLALAGSLGEEYQVVYSLGVKAVMTLLPAPLSLQEAMTQAASLLADASERAARLLLLGQQLSPS